MPPRVIAFVNGALGAQALGVLGASLVGVVVHEPDRQRDAAALRAAVPHGIPGLTASQLATVGGAWLTGLNPTHGLSVLFGHLLRAPIRAKFPHGIANIHPSLLPWGRGAHPNVWALAKREPAGVTLHLIDEGLDTGPLLAQREVVVEPSDDAQRLYQRLLDTAEAMLGDDVQRWLAGELTASAQRAGGSAHRVADLESLAIDPDQTYRGRELIDLLRARSFAPYPGARYVVDGRRLRLRLVIEEEP